MHWTSGPLLCPRHICTPSVTCVRKEEGDCKKVSCLERASRFQALVDKETPSLWRIRVQPRLRAVARLVLALQVLSVLWNAFRNIVSSAPFLAAAAVPLARCVCAAPDPTLLLAPSRDLLLRCQHLGAPTCAGGRPKDDGLFLESSRALRILDSLMETRPWTPLAVS